jgi:hypothetical protein
MAYDASISVSSTYNSSRFALKHINDGDLSTRWGTDYSVTRENEYVIADLGKVCAVDRVKINFEEAYATKYKIQGSTDGKTYTDLTGELTGAIGEQFISNLNANVRYIKLSFIEAATEYGYSICELGIYCPRQYELNVSLDALEEKLNQVETTYGSHVHYNKSILDILQYTGKQIEFDLIILEELEKSLDSYLKNLSTYKLEVESLYNKNIDLLKKYREEIIKVNKEIQEFINKSSEWLDNVCNYTDKNIEIYKNKVLQQLIKYVSNNKLQ